MAEGSLPHLARLLPAVGASVRGLWAPAPNRSLIAVQHKTAAMLTQDFGLAATAQPISTVPVQPGVGAPRRGGTTA
jgi:hypothetical protein